MVDFSLTNKIALITGASRGIGEAIAIALAEHGARCIQRSIDALEVVEGCGHDIAATAASTSGKYW